jgi:hypothetical protein
MNSHIALKAFKMKAVRLCRKHQKIVQLRLQNVIKALQKGLDKIVNLTYLTSKEINTQVHLTTEKISTLEKKQ